MHHTVLTQQTQQLLLLAAKLDEELDRLDSRLNSSGDSTAANETFASNQASAPLLLAPGVEPAASIVFSTGLPSLELWSREAGQAHQEKIPEFSRELLPNGFHSPAGLASQDCAAVHDRSYLLFNTTRSADTNPTSALVSCHNAQPRIYHTAPDRIQLKANGIEAIQVQGSVLNCQNADVRDEEKFAAQRGGALDNKVRPPDALHVSASTCSISLQTQ